MTDERTTRREPVLALLLIVMGLLVVWLAVQWLPHWDQVAPGLTSHLVIFLAAGIPVVLAGAALLTGRLVGLAGWVGGAAAAICGINLLLGIGTRAIPCSSPT